jgi:hypothetical protein
MSFIIRHVPDSFSRLRLMGGNEVDVILTDPPYSEHVHENLCSGSLVGTKAVPKYELTFDPIKEYSWLLDCTRIAKRWVVSFCDVEAFGLIKTTAPGQYVRGGIWYKKNAMGQLTADRPATAYEGVAILHGTRDDGHPKKQWNGRGSYGIWRANGTRGLKGRHPNQKPLDLALKLVALFSNRGETVFNPFNGSGTIGVACLMLGRTFIGFDSDPEWVTKAGLRLAAPVVPMTDEDALKLCSMKGEDPPMEPAP